MVTLILFLTCCQGTSLDQYGTTHDPSRPGQSVTVLDFAASWCKPCWKALPHVEQLSKGDVPVLVISVDEKQAGRDRLVQQLNLTVPVVWDDGHRWAEAYDPKGMPCTMIVDSNGRILYQHVGYNPKLWQGLLQRLQELKP